MKMKLVIERSKWLRGEGWEKSSLLRSSDKKMCCLRFLGEACGVSRDLMWNKGSPRQLSEEAKVMYPAGLFQLRYDDGGLSPMGRLMNINDHPNLSEEIREKMITDKMSDLGIAVEFI